MLDQIPTIAEGVAKDGDDPIGLAPRRFEKGYTRLCERLVIAAKIFRLQKERHPAAGLVADGRLLGRPVGLRQQQCRAAAPRRDTHPSSGVRQFRIVQKLKAERAAVEVDCRVIIRHDQRDRGDARGHPAAPACATHSSLRISINRDTVRSNSKTSAPFLAW